MNAITGKEREDLRLDLAVAAMTALIPTFGNEVEARRGVIAHKAFLLAESMLRAADARAWELPQ